MTMPIVGEPFNPWHEACGFWPEDVVDRQRDLGDGPKRVYRKLRRYAGTKGSCFPSQKALADELGKGERQVRRDLDELEAAGLIASKSRDGRRSNTYLFLWHAMFERSSTSGQATDPSGHGCPLNDDAAEQSEPYLSARDRTDMTGVTRHPCPPNPFSESLQEKSKQAAAGEKEEFSSKAPADVPRKRAAGSSPEFASDAPRLPDEQHVEGFSDMRMLLDRYHVKVQPGQIQALIEGGRAQGLTLDGIFAFVAEKLKQKRDQNDPVFSAKLLIRAISNEADLHHFAVKRQGCSSLFEQKSTRCAAPFSVAELRDHLSAGAHQLRQITGFAAIVSELDLLAADAEAQYSDLEALEQRLTRIEREMTAIARSHQTEADAIQQRQELEKELSPYRGKMTKEQIAMLESQLLERRLLESYDLPRLSLFYLRVPSRAA